MRQGLYTPGGTTIINSGDGTGSTPQFVYNQIFPATIWVIVHNLNKHPAIMVADTTGRVVSGDITYDSPNQLTATFSYEFGGTAYLT